MINDFFQPFKSTFILTDSESLAESISETGIPLELLFSSFAGATFDNGLYRIHCQSSSRVWNNLILESFPKLEEQFDCFGYDWCGRQYAVNKSNDKLYMFDCAAFEYMVLDSDLIKFHNIILTENKFDTLLEDEFEEWLNVNSKPLNFTECVGFKIPLFLGGNEDISNLELCDMKFYWELTTQLYNKL